MLADMHVLVRHIRRMAGHSRYANLSDRTLLECFAREGDQEAFAALVNRHALLVAGVCRRVLANSHDGEDVFQNTFLTLARKAGKIGWHESVANWLHGVAHRLALRSRSNTIRREELHEAAREKLASREMDRQTQELRTILDAELSELADRHRLPLVLCYLEGRTRDEAARHCGWSLRTLERRLEQGRSLLRKRCLRHGLDLSVILLAAALADQQASARSLLVAKTMDAVRAAVNAGALGTAVAQQATHTVSLAAANYLKLTGGLSLVLTLAAFGAYAWTGHVSAEPSLVAEPNIPALPNDGRKEPVPAQRPDRQVVFQPSARLGSVEFRASGVSKVQYSSDGSKLLTVGSQGLQIFDAASGRLLLQANLEGPAVVATAALSADGKLAALEDLNGVHPAIYDTSTGRVLCRLQIPAKRSVRLTSFSRDGRLLATQVDATWVELYDTATGKLVRTIKWKGAFPPDEKQAYLGEIGFLPDGKSIVVSIPASGNIRGFDITTGKETRQIAVSPKGMAGMMLSPDGKTLLALPNILGLTQAGSFFEKSDGKVVILDTATGKKLNELSIPRILPPTSSTDGVLTPYIQPVFPFMLAIGPDNNTLFAGGSKTARTGIGRWDLTTGAYLNSVALPWPHLSDMPIAISPNGKTLACFCDSTLHQIDIATGRNVVELPGHQGPITSVATSSTHYVTGSEDGKVLLWDRASGKLLLELGQPARAVRKILLDSEGSRIFVLYAQRNVHLDDANLRAYRIADGKMLWQLHPPRRDHLLEGTASTALNGNQLAVLNSQSILYLDAETGRVVRTDPLQKIPASENVERGPKIPAMMYSKLQEELLIWNVGHLHIGSWSLNQLLNAPLQFETMPLAFASSAQSAIGSSVVFSPDGRLLALPMNVKGHRICFVETNGYQRIRSVDSGEEGPIPHLVFSPNSKELAWIAKQGKTIHLADVSTGDLISAIPIASSNASALSFTDDGKSLLVGCDDSTAVIYDLSKLPDAK